MLAQDTVRSMAAMLKTATMVNIASKITINTFCFGGEYSLPLFSCCGSFLVILAGLALLLRVSATNAGNRFPWRSGALGNFLWQE